MLTNRKKSDEKKCVTEQRNNPKDSQKFNGLNRWMYSTALSNVMCSLSAKFRWPEFTNATKSPDFISTIESY